MTRDRLYNNLPGKKHRLLPSNFASCSHRRKEHSSKTTNIIRKEIR